MRASAQLSQRGKQRTQELAAMEAMTERVQEALQAAEAKAAGDAADEEAWTNRNRAVSFREPMRNDIEEQEC